ncbi:MAG: hypothetical protein KAY32_03340 [Candidatus Eisenbacteria sp.]|nr:hypothetical protein [Candidatus Eisenbacteria bacterium]
MTINEYEWKDRIPERFWAFLDGRALQPVLDLLQRDYAPVDVVRGFQGEKHEAAAKVWEFIAFYYRDTGKYEQARQVLSECYQQCLEGQSAIGARQHKGAPLIWMQDLHMRLGHQVLSKRYAMLTLIEDAISGSGHVGQAGDGTYKRLAWQHHMSDSDIERHSQHAFSIYESDRVRGQFPEHVLLSLDDDWMTEFPTVGEAPIFIASRAYTSFLLSRLGDRAGRSLEDLARYLLSVIPGFRTKGRQSSATTEYDVICAVEGPNQDFRQELGRYILCECKDLKDRAGVSIVAKFARVLDSAKCRAGILFSSKGVTGGGRGTYAEREILKVYQDRGVAIIVVDGEDIKRVAGGFSFLTMLRQKYEKIRLDLAD